LPSGSLCRARGSSGNGALKSRKDMHSSYGVGKSSVRERYRRAAVSLCPNKGRMRQQWSHNMQTSYFALLLTV
jgi:hypothetical protein